MTLFQIAWSEMKYQLRSVVFWILVIVTFVFYNGQFGSDVGGQILEPQPPVANVNGEMPYYGSTMNLTPEEEMREFGFQLSRDLNYNQGFDRHGLLNKRIKFRPAQKAAMERMRDLLQSNALTYTEFQAEARALDELLGGNTIYGPRFRFLLHRPLTYEEAVEEYQTMIHTEGVTNAHGRLFADYLGITAGLFPAFLAAFLLGRDRRTRMNELIRAKKVRPFTYVFGKYLAVTILLSVTYLLIALHPTWSFYQLSVDGGWPFHWWGFLRYALCWVIPTMMFTVAMAMIVAELTGNGLIALAVQMVLWYTSVASLMGDYSLSKYIIRFNTSGMYDLLQRSAHAITINRIFYVVLSIGLIALCSLIWQWKGVKGRAGRYDLKRWFGNRQIQQQDSL